MERQLSVSGYLEHVEEQAPELGPLDHEECHLVAELGGREGKAAVRHRLLVDGPHDLSQHLLGVGGVLGLLHEGGELGVHVTAVVPHAVQDLHQLVHLVWLRIARLDRHFVLGVWETRKTHLSEASVGLGWPEGRRENPERRG